MSSDIPQYCRLQSSVLSTDWLAALPFTNSRAPRAPRLIWLQHDGPACESLCFAGARLHRAHTHAKTKHKRTSSLDTTLTNKMMTSRMLAISNPHHTTEIHFVSSDRHQVIFRRKTSRQIAGDSPFDWSQSVSLIVELSSMSCTSFLTNKRGIAVPWRWRIYGDFLFLRSGGVDKLVSQTQRLASSSDIGNVGSLFRLGAAKLVELK